MVIEVTDQKEDHIMLCVSNFLYNLPKNARYDVVFNRCILQNATLFHLDCLGGSFQFGALYIQPFCMCEKRASVVLPARMLSAGIKNKTKTNVPVVNDCGSNNE